MNHTNDIKENERYTEKLQFLVNGLFRYTLVPLQQVCHNSMLWKVSGTIGGLQNLDSLQIALDEFQTYADTYSLYLRQIQCVKISQDFVLTTCVVMKEYGPPKTKYNREYYDVLATFVHGKAAFVNITTILEHYPVRSYKICSTTKELYVLTEQDILYIEACHNHVIWHCRNVIITANDTLQHLEHRLSASFVRIQRGYLVNKHQVKHIRRCEVEMSNGDVLSIPCKKYVAVREKLST